MKKNGGFTIVELMVVVGIAILLLSWGLPGYSSWRRKHDAESQIMRLYSDLQFARMTAYSHKVSSGVWWGGGTVISNYQIRMDGNGNGTIDDSLGSGGDTQVGSTVDPKLDVTTSASQNSVSFDSRGFLNTNPLTFTIGGTGASANCVSVSNTRIIVGKMNGGTCTPQ